MIFKHTRLLIFFLSLLFCSTIAFGQETEKGIQYTYQTFKDTRIINGHSIETSEKGELKFIISHRFGELNGGGQELWGLDQSTIRLGFDYGITNNLNVGIGRSSFQKTFDGFVKWKFKTQSSGAKNMPVTLTAFANITLNSSKNLNTEIDFPFSNRLSYTGQLFIARKFSNRFSLQLSPTFLHRNFVQTRAESNSLVLLGIISRLQISKVTAIQIEYYPVVSGELQNARKESLAVGFEFHTKAHIFQVHLSNSIGMVEPLFLAETIGSWSDFGIRLGFNITRDFRLGSKKFKN